MATELYVFRLARILVEAMGLTVADSEEILKKSIEAALSGWLPEEDVEFEDQYGDKKFHKKNRRIFPTHSYCKEYDEEAEEEIWVKNRPWGEGSNEDPDFILYAVKQIVLQNAGLSKFSWETARKYDAQFLKEIAEGLRQTESDRGPGSPYTQDYGKELELAFEFGVETIVRWHDGQHKANWANFVEEMYHLWRLWGKEAVVEVDKSCGEKIRWFASFAASHTGYGYNADSCLATYDQALCAWKRSNWVHAVTKIGHSELAKLDQEFGRKRIDGIIKTNAEKITGLNESLRPLALRCLTMGDVISWIKDEFADASVAREVCELSQKNKKLPFVLAAELKEVFRKGGLGWNNITTIFSKSQMSWEEIKVVVERNGQSIASLDSLVRSSAIMAFHLFPADNVSWLQRSFAYVYDEEPIWIIKKAQEINSIPSEISRNVVILNDFGLSFNNVKDLVDKIGWRNTILWPLEFRNEFQGIPDENLVNAIQLHRSGDDVGWLRRELDSSGYENEFKTTITWAYKGGMPPSAMGNLIGLAKEKAKLSWSQVVEAKKRITDNFASVVIIFAEQISATISDCRVKAAELLHQNSSRNTNWWPQAIDSAEFNAGLAAEKLGKEGLAGIQRRRWLKERLGMDWTPNVDKRMGWEESSEIIVKNPWLKTALNFVDKEQVILDLAAGKDITHLKYMATEQELKAAETRKKITEKLAAIKSTWLEDIKGWFEKIVEVVGEQMAWDYIGNRNRHDQLFFVEAMLTKLSVKNLQTILLQVRADYGRFAQAVNAYEPEGIEFQSFKEFAKHVDLQKGRIVFPADASEVLRERIAEMLEAPGVSVSHIRTFVGDRKNWPLIIGEEDKKAVFPSMKMEFTAEPLEMILSRALGKRNPQKPEDMAQAEKPELLFKKLGKLTKGVGLKGGAVELTKFVPEDLEQEVIELLREHKVKLGTIYTAEVAKKSDPVGWTCGDWTNCCMQFGSSKNDEYMRRRDMSYFLVSNGRLMAQSVVVAAAHASRNGTTPKLEAANLSNIDAVGLDNVEVASNYKDHKSIIESAYRKFWKQYSKKYGSHWTVMIGKSHNDALPAKKTAKMVWKPLEKMVYSDCFGNSEAYVLVEPKKEVANEKVC